MLSHAFHRIRTLFTIASLLVAADLASGLYRGGANVCSQTVARSVSYQTRIGYTAYENYRTCCSHFMWCWSKCTKSRAVTRYKLEKRYRRVYETRLSCCSGWLQGAGSSECRIAVCNRPSCVYGTCVRPNTCSCRNGFTSPATGCNRDINECANLNGGCQQQCNNHHGGYSCACRRGFTLYNSKRCKDNNECALSNGLCSCDDAANNPSCSATCKNTIGSFRCACSHGYMLVASTRCVDTNECMANNGGCDHLCSNLPGSFRCSCRVGFKLGADGKSCSDVNECLTSNGGCEDQCINKLGSYQCRCSNGHILDTNGRTCSDFDECATHFHGCQHKCNNYKGGYFCSCRAGYKLNPDNQTCSDVDECQIIKNGGSVTLGGCTHLCHNSIGSFSCSCRSGFKLASDGKTCKDFNECSGNNSCQQQCFNTIGSYVCKCNQGFRLNTNGKSCDALPCIRLPPLINGNATCFTGKTNDVCRLGCHVGFELRGSSKRQCLPNHKWNGSLTTCKRKHCDELQPTMNSFIVLPCMRYYQATCSLTCASGYFATGPTKLRCKATGANQMYWHNSNTICKKITICSPNPCKHKGKCIPISKTKYRCNCHKTGYNGPTCNRGIISIPEQPIMRVNQRHNFTITARPEKQLILQIRSSNNGLRFTTSDIVFTSSKSSVEVSMQAKQSGMYAITYNTSGEDADNFDQPMKGIVFVREDKMKSLTHIDNVINDKGALVQGCYESSKLQVTERAEKRKSVILHSTEHWQQQKEYDMTDGIISMSIEGHVLPASLVGSRVSTGQIENRDFGSFIERFSLSDILNETTPTAPSRKSEMKCVSRQPSTKYLTEIAELNSFPKTVVDAVNARTPYWVNLFAELSTETFYIGDFVANVYKNSKVKSVMPGCGLLMSNNFNGHELYTYATNQKMLLHVAEEELELDTGKQVCIFQSVQKRDVFIGFPQSEKQSSSLMAFSGWHGKMKSMEFYNNNNNNEKHQIQGKFSTTLKYGGAKLVVQVSGRIDFSASNDSKFPSSGITAYSTIKSSGMISVMLKGGSRNSTENFSFSGKGAFTFGNASKLEKKGCPQNNFVVTIEPATSKLIGRRLQKHVQMNSNAKVALKFSVKQSGGGILRKQNVTECLNTDKELRKLNATISNILRQALNGNHYSTLTGSLKEMLAFSSELLTLCRQLSGGKMLKPLIQLKKTVNIVQRKFQIFSSMLQKSLSTKAFLRLLKDYDNSMRSALAALKTRLMREKLFKIVRSYSIASTGTICAGNLCFSNSKIEIIEGLSKSQLERCYDVRSLQDNSTAILGYTGKERTLAGLLKIPKDTRIVLVLDDRGLCRSYFKASFSIYGASSEVRVTVVNNSLSFSANTKLPDGSNATFDCSADLTFLKQDGDVLLTVKGVLGNGSGLINRINRDLHSKLARMADVTKSRVSNLKNALEMSHDQQRESMLHLDKVKTTYRTKLANEENLERQLKIASAKYQYLKSILLPRVKKFNSMVANYTEAIEKCAPRICTSKCTPGVVKQICHDERFITVLVKSCNLRTKNYVKTEHKQVTKVGSYITHDEKSSCQTKCPPLTGFFKKVFGRKRRGLITTLVSKLFGGLVKKATEEFFNYLGGETAATGAKIGAMLPGPWGIVGMFVGGIIGSAFGSCDRTCHVMYTPKQVFFKKYDVEKVLRTVFYKETVCKDVIKEKKGGFHHGYECFSQNNCSLQLTDTKCVHENQRCFTLRRLLRQKIDEQRDLGPTFDDYEAQSLKLESLETAKRFATADRKNAARSLSSAKSIVVAANQSLDLAKRSLANTNTLFALELKATQAVQRVGIRHFNVDSGRWIFQTSKDSHTPSSVAMDMVVNGENSQKVASMAIVDFSNANESASFAADQVIRNLFGKSERSRSRRSAGQPSDPQTITLPGANLNVTKARCLRMENNIFYLIKVATEFNRGVLQIENSSKEMEKAEQLKADYMQSISDKIRKSDLCKVNGSSSRANCSTGWLHDSYKNLTSDSAEQKNLSTSWPVKRMQIISNLEVYTDDQNYTACSGLRDCVQNSLATISELVKYDKSYLAKLTRKAIPHWTTSFKYVLENLPSSQNLTKKNANWILDSIKASKPTLIYCDSPPIITKDLPPTIIVKQTESLLLEFKLQKSYHASTFVWRKNGNVIPSSTKNKLFLFNINSALRGFYNCEISNKFGKVSTQTVQVIYQEKPTISRHPKGVKKVWKTPSPMIALMCNATGIPKPTFTWAYSPFSNITQRTALSHNQSVLQFNASSPSQSGFYTCNASNAQGYVLSRPARVHVLASRIAEFSVKISFSVKSARHSNTSVVSMPAQLTGRDRENLTTFLATQMNISNTRISNMYFSKSDNQSGLLSFDIKAKDLNGLLSSSSTADWTAISQDMVMARKGLLVMALWLHHVFSNVSSAIMIGSVNATVDADTVDADPQSAQCPEAYSLHSNGFICEICSAGTKFVVADACKACPVGSYQPLQGQSSCIRCPSNYTTRSSGSVHSGDCYLPVAPTTKRPTSSIGTNDPTSGKKIETTDTSRPSTAPAKPTNTDDSTPGHVSRETKTAGHASTTSRPFERPVPRPQKKNSSKIWIAIGSSFAVAFLIFGLLGFLCKKYGSKAKEDNGKIIANADHTSREHLALSFSNNSYGAFQGPCNEGVSENLGNPIDAPFDGFPVFKNIPAETDQHCNRIQVQPYRPYVDEQETCA